MRYLIVVVAILFSFSNLFAQDKEANKIDDAIEVLEDLKDLPIDGEEDITEELMEDAEAVVIIPKLKKGGLIVGGKFGKGIVLIKNEDGSWSDPAFVKIAGGSLGFQIGYTSSDLFLVFRNKKILKQLSKDKGRFTLGADVTVAAGKQGRSASANTDVDFEAEIFSYSKSRGVFAGVSLDGSEIKIDNEANENFYGDEDNGKQIVKSGASNLKSSNEIDQLKAELNKL